MRVLTTTPGAVNFGNSRQETWQTVVKVYVAKNRVQPANSLQANSFASRVVKGRELVAVPIFRSRGTLATGC